MSANMGTAITIDNFRTSMSTFDPASTTNHLYGLVDMGSNGIRFSISDLSPPGSRLMPCVYRERSGISLYDALHESTPDAEAFHFSRHTIIDVAETLGRFRVICDGFGVQRERISVFATEAMRTAKNQEEIMLAIKEASGLTVDILTPGMESLFGAMGARSGYTEVDGLFMDLGGGSVQMTYVNSKGSKDYDVAAAQAATSMPFGAAKLTLAMSTQESADTAKIELRASMKSSFTKLEQQFPRLKEQAESTDGITIYFCGGGFRGYGSMLMHTDPIQPYPIPSIGGYTVAGHRFMKWREMLHTNNYEEGKIYGMSKRRREQFPAIVAVVQSLIEAIPKIKKVIFCAGGNREGVLFMKLPAKVRESDPIPLLPSTAPDRDDNIITALVRIIKTALPPSYPTIFSDAILHSVSRNTWMDQGHDANSTRVMHNAIAGLLAGHPGLTHELRAILALTLCARWGADLGPVDLKVYTNLQSLVGSELSWWCQYIGATARFLASVIPSFPANEDILRMIKFEPSMTQGLGKKGHKVGVRLKISLPKKMCQGFYIGTLEDYFGKIGKGVSLAWKVEAEISEV